MAFNINYYFSARRVRSNAMSMSVCSVRSYISKTKRPTELHQIFINVSDRGSVLLLWWRCDTLCNSGFVDDVMLFINGPWCVMCVLITRQRFHLDHYNTLTGSHTLLVKCNHRRSAPTTGNARNRVLVRFDLDALDSSTATRLLPHLPALE